MLAEMTLHSIDDDGLKMKTALICWLGKTDINCATGILPGLGPIAEVQTQRKYASVELISNWPKKDVAKYVSWLREKTTARINLHEVQLSSPMNYGEIYERADDVVTTLLKKEPVSLIFHLSPGTSAMAAIWLVLAKTKYPAELVSSSQEEGVKTVDFPFDISADYLPRQRAAVKGELVRNAFEERTPPAFDKIIHRCDEMKRVISRAQRVAQYDVPVMILGETGTGKELFAEAIHHASPRAKGPFVAVNCGAIPRELVEAELFGFVKGAFTGADAPRNGLIEQSHQGTLFLDELGELPLDVQVKLLRALQTGEVRPVGSKDVKKIDFRVISATHRDLEKAISEQRFREDLYHRLAVGILMLPPLRQRSGDLPLLVDFRLNQLTSTLVKGADSVMPKLSPGARALINQQPWSGNIRELFNALTRAVIWCEGGTIEKQDMQSALSSFSAGNVKCPVLDQPLTEGFSIKHLLEDVEKHFIRKATKESPTRAAAARLLGYESGPALKYRQEALGIADTE
jgi:transcriptional regulator with PAS, ATPase and Fis domain